MARFPPTIVFHNGIDPIVRPSEHSEPLNVALTHVMIVHEPAAASCGWYNDHSDLGLNNVFQTNSVADINS